MGEATADETSDGESSTGGDGGTGGQPPSELPDCTHFVTSDSESEDWDAATDSSTPCTPQIAMQHAAAGDVVCFRGGTYEPGEGPGSDVPAYNPANSGTEQAPIYFIGHPGEEAVIHEATSASHPSGTQPAIGVYGGAHVVWANFTLVRNLDNGIGASTMVSFDSAEHVTLRNCDISGGTPHLDHTNGVLIMVLNSTDVRIHDNQLHDMVGSDAPTEPTVNTGAMWLFDHDDIRVFNNDIYNVYSGVQWKDDPSQVQVYRNHFWGCQSSAIQASPQGDDADFEIHQNVSRDCPTFVFTPDPPAIHHRLRIYNNTIFNTEQGTLALLGETQRDAMIFNNIIVNEGAGSLFVRYYGGDSFPYSDHNDFVGGGLWNMDYATDYASLEEWAAGSGADSSSVGIDPFFVNPGGVSPEDYQLQPRSPLLTAGIDALDFDGDGDTQEAIPMGAYITGDEVIGAHVR